MLTDKVCRDVDTLKEGSRVAWASQEPSARGSQSHATHQQFAKDEKYWRLLDDMKTIGAKYGSCQTSTFIYFPSSYTPVTRAL